MLRKSKFLKINDIKSTKLFTSEYIVINFIILDEFNNKTINARFTRFVYIVENFKVNILFNNNIFDLKNIVVYINKQKFIVNNCDDFSTSLKVVTKNNERINRIVQFQTNIFVSIHICMSIFTKFCGSKLLVDRNIIFNSNYIERLSKKNDSFFHIIDVNFCAVQMKNVTNASIAIIKNKRLNILINYEKKSCYLINSKIRHLAADS